MKNNKPKSSKNTNIKYESGVIPGINDKDIKYSNGKLKQTIERGKAASQNNDTHHLSDNLNMPPYKVFDTDLARDNLENDLTSSDLQDLY